MDGVAYWEVRASCCSSYSTKVLHVKNREKIYAQEKTLMTKSSCLSSCREKVAKKYQDSGHTGPTTTRLETFEREFERSSDAEFFP